MARRIAAIQVGRRKDIAIELSGFKEARARLQELVKLADNQSSGTAKQQVLLSFTGIASEFADDLRSAAASSNVANRVIRNIFVGRLKNRFRVSVLAGAAKRFSPKYPNTKNGGLRMEWKDFTKKAGDNPGKKVGMSLATAYDQGTKRTKKTGFFERTFRSQRPKMLQKMIEAYKEALKWVQ